MSVGVLNNIRLEEMVLHLLCLLMLEGLGFVSKKTKCTGVVKIKQLTKTLCQNLATDT